MVQEGWGRELQVEGTAYAKPELQIFMGSGIGSRRSKSRAGVGGEYREMTLDSL